MHQPVQESAGREHHCAGCEVHAQCGYHTRYPTLLQAQLHHRVLPDVEVRGVFKDAAPLGHEAHAVRLSTRAPHGRPLAAIEHAELDGCAVGHNPHLPAKGIYLSHYLTFSYSAHSRIATHLSYLVHVDGNEQRARAQPCGRARCLTAGMAGANHYHIVVESHFFQIVAGATARAAFSWCSMISRSPTPLSFTPHKCSTP